MTHTYLQYFHEKGKGYRPRKVPNRDSQKARVYKAERDAFATVMHPNGFLNYPQDLPAAEVQKFVRSVTRSKKWKRLCYTFGVLRDTTPKAKLTSGRRYSKGRPSSITINQDYHLCKLVVLHELAHGIVPHAGHNWPFAYAFHALVSRFLGAEAAKRLKRAFRANRVRCTPPRILTPSQREKLRERGRQLQQRRLSLTQQPISAEPKETL